MVDAKTVGNAISVCRREKGLTQDELSTRLAVTPQAISRWERGNSLPDIDFLPDLSRILDISVDDLLSGNLPKGGTFKTGQGSAGSEAEGSVMNLLLPDDILVLISYDLFLDNEDFAKAMTNMLIEEIKELRKTLARELGMLLPTIRIRDDSSIPKEECHIFFRDKLMGIQKPLNGDSKPKACAAVIAAELKRFISDSPGLIISRQMVKAIVDNAAIKNPVLIEETIPSKVNYGRLRLILIELLKANKPIKDMITILEIIDENESAKTVEELSAAIAEAV